MFRVFSTVSVFRGVPVFRCSGVPSFSTILVERLWSKSYSVVLFQGISGKSENCCDFFRNTNHSSAHLSKCKQILLGGSVMSLVVAACVKFSRQFPHWTAWQKQGLVFVAKFFGLPLAPCEIAYFVFFRHVLWRFLSDKNFKILWIRWSSFTDVSLKTSPPESESGGLRALAWDFRMSCSSFFIVWKFS